MQPWNLNRIITKVNTLYGAPFGRFNKGTFPKQPTKVYDKKVPLIDGYDKGGAYWGVGKELRVKFTPSLDYIEFYRID